MMLIVHYRIRQKDKVDNIMDSVFIVTDESKSCYDAAGIFVGVFSTYEQARHILTDLAARLEEITI